MFLLLPSFPVFSRILDVLIIHSDKCSVWKRLLSLDKVFLDPCVQFSSHPIFDPITDICTRNHGYR